MSPDNICALPENVAQFFEVFSLENSEANPWDSRSERSYVILRSNQAYRNISET